jgi:hypothetical protein
MDPFDEFEFKPLTDGLGFHKKKSTGQKFNKEEETFTSKKFIKDQGLSLLDEVNVNPLSTPLPRKKINPGLGKISINQNAESNFDINSDSSPTNPVDDILKTLQKNRRFNIEEESNGNKALSNSVTTSTILNSTKPLQQISSFKSATKTMAKTTELIAPKAKESSKALSWTFESSLLDAMLITAASILCMIILLVITKTDLIGNLTHPDDNGMIYLSTLGMFAVVSFIYLSVNRIFLGYTPGEWAFDERIGNPEDLNSKSYSIKIIARSALVVLTGFILLPIISMLFRKDIAGQITGARIMRKA